MVFMYHPCYIELVKFRVPSHKGNIMSNSMMKIFEKRPIVIHTMVHLYQYVDKEELAKHIQATNTYDKVMDAYGQYAFAWYMANFWNYPKDISIVGGTVMNYKAVDDRLTNFHIKTTPHGGTITSGLIEIKDKWEKPCRPPLLYDDDVRKNDVIGLVKFDIQNGYALIISTIPASMTGGMWKDPISLVNKGYKLAIYNTDIEKHPLAINKILDLMPMFDPKTEVPKGPKTLETFLKK